MAITFGAVGDIISVSLLIKDLLVALDDSRGASCEYRAIVRELYTLDSAILHVERLSRTHDATPELHALYGTARATVTRCRECIEDFKQKLKKYRGSMVAGGSGNPVKDIGRRLQWSMAEKDHIARFRAEVTGYSNSIHMLIATAGVGLLQKHQERLSDDMRITLQDAALQEIRSRLDENEKQVTRSNCLSSKLTERVEWIKHLGCELRSLIQQVIRVSFRNYRLLVRIDKAVTAGICRPMTEEPIIFEDALGRIAPIHLRFISSWEAFDAILLIRFKNRAGFEMVRRKEYTLHEQSTNREIDQAADWDTSIIPGEKINMSLTFKIDSSQQRPAARKRRRSLDANCPYCHATSSQPAGSVVQCHSCHRHFQRILEHYEADALPPHRMPNPWKSHAKFGKPAFLQPIYGPQRPHRKRALHDTDPEGSAFKSFKRIRVIHRQMRIKNPGPFHSTVLPADSPGFHSLAMGGAVSTSVTVSGSVFSAPWRPTDSDVITSLPQQETEDSLCETAEDSQDSNTEEDCQHKDAEQNHQFENVEDADEANGGTDSHPLSASDPHLTGLPPSPFIPLEITAPTIECSNLKISGEPWIRSLYFSPDSLQLSSVLHDSSVQLWDVATGAAQNMLNGHIVLPSHNLFPDFQSDIIFSPDSKLIASGVETSEAQFWSASTGECLDTLSDNSGGINAMVFCPTSNLLASTSSDSKIRLWDTDAKKILKELDGHESGASAIAFSPDGRLVAAASDYHTIRLWDIALGTRSDLVGGHQCAVSNVVFSQDGKLLATTDSRGNIIIWDVEKKTRQQTFKGHVYGIYRIAFSPDGSRIISGSFDRSVQIWNVTTGKCESMAYGKLQPPKSQMFTPDGKFIVSKWSSNKNVLWGVSGSVYRPLPDAVPDAVYTTFSPDGQLLALATKDNTIEIWDVSKWERRTTVDVNLIKPRLS